MATRTSSSLSGGPKVVTRHGAGDLASDLFNIAAETRPRGRAVVRDGLRVGVNLSKQYAREKSGKHGSRYYKRITASMDRGLGLFGNSISGEFGPSGTPKTEFLGAGFRHGHNTDLARAADIVGPAFERSVDDMVGDMFREAEFL